MQLYLYNHQITIYSVNRKTNLPIDLLVLF